VILCPMCRQEELVGTLYCSECGAELFHLDVSPPKTVLYGNEGRHGTGGVPQPVSEANAFFNAKATTLVFLRILETGQILPLEDSEEFTLGRISGSQPILPDIDLTPYKAYEGGVSRLHATIKIDREQVTITDLGSANGTRINSKKIAAHQPYSLNDEDILSLGKFKAQILIQRN
jgi:FHA domain